MSFEDSFSAKFRLLRETHGLSTAQAADFFSFKASASISDLEFKRVTPSPAVLDTTVDLFGVSIDWLAGKSNIIYRPEIILGIEEKLAILGDSTCSWMTSYAKYADTKKRQTTFSLPVRANIIFCRQVLRKSAEIRSNEIIPYSNGNVVIPDALYDNKFELYKDKLWHWLYPVMEKMDGKRRANIRWNLCSACFDYLQDYIVVPDDDKRKRTTPVFDVEAAWKELQAKNEKE